MCKFWDSTLIKMIVWFLIINRIWLKISLPTDKKNSLLCWFCHWFHCLAIENSWENVYFVKNNKKSIDKI